MGATPDQLRHEIERTRADLTGDVDRLVDRTSPSRIVDRRVERARGGLRKVKDKVMGVADDLTPSGGGSGAVDAVREQSRSVAESTQQVAHQTTDAVRRQTQGSPLAAGLIAFGAGLLTASLIPTSQAEKRVAAQVRDQAGDLVEPVRHAATEAAANVGGDLRESAQHAAEQVKQTAVDAAQEVKDSAQSGAQDAKEGVRHAASGS
ncbi:DUF3618 domain-containing protein [Actinokineospora bangkokensis]|uniref:DUF3618 domain-containing protein n=1 Tax=Actinokineospora bangkokensis TaxID=1193682 RepID=A0A1Q9LMD8_9PSEU|nr:DUF3618 domain-containing protein [Actinokineospora bangkokensis]OLR93207.1 hypothetical protein BJP25_17080 [Actinokineospora bangkokensis]